MNSNLLTRKRQMALCMLLGAGAIVLAAAPTLAKTAGDAPAHPAPAPYAKQEVERAFGFMDANNDGRISRDEAAGFRGVARHFDAADSNRDSMLSRAEFESALNKRKPAEPAAKAAASSQIHLK